MGGNFANVILAIISPAARRMMCDISPCGGGRTFLTITANGDMVPCGEFISFKEFSGGNIFKTSIEKGDELKNHLKQSGQGLWRILMNAAPATSGIYAARHAPLRCMREAICTERAEFCEFYKEMIRYALN